MSARKLLLFSSVIILPALYIAFYPLEVWAHGRPLTQMLKVDALLLLVTIMVLEQIYGYRNPASQRFVLTRDLIANVVNKYVTGAAMALLVLPPLLYVPQHILGRKVFVASPGELGPF